MNGPTRHTRRHTGRLPAALLFLIAATAATTVAADGPPLRKAKAPTAPKPTTTPEPKRLTPAILDASLAVGGKYLMRSQREDGSFLYKYNALTGEVDDSDNSVRQAGSLWGLALVHAATPSPKMAGHVRRGLDFLISHSKVHPDGGRYIVYPVDSRGKTGTLALFTLALIDFLRSPHGMTKEEEKGYRKALDESLTFLLSLRNESGQFYKRYDHETGEGDGSPSPYYDGESLLAMCKAAKYLGYEALEPKIMESAEKMYNRYVTLARQDDPDSNKTKGFFQWGLMSYYEIFTSDWEGREAFGERSVELGIWMIDVHRTLRRPLNTSYAHEGMACAWEIARLTGDAAGMKKLGDTIDIGLSKITGWQFGGPTPNTFIRSSRFRPEALGGVMNSKRDPVLRIDVTQHQMHAVILARRFLYK